MYLAHRGSPFAATKCCKIDLIERRWLKPNGRDSRFEITEESMQAEGELSGLH